MRERGQREEKQACRLVWILLFFLPSHQNAFSGQSQGWPWQRSHKSLFVCSGLVSLGKRNRERCSGSEHKVGSVSTLLHSVELWRGVSTVTVQRRWGLSPLTALRSTAVPMASPGTEPHEAVCPSGKLAEGLRGFAAAKVDGLMWFRGSAKVCWGVPVMGLENDSWILSWISMEDSHSQNFDCWGWAAKCSRHILAT